MIPRHRTFIFVQWVCNWTNTFNLFLNTRKTLTRYIQRVRFSIRYIDLWKKMHCFLFIFKYAFGITYKLLQFLPVTLNKCWRAIRTSFDISNSLVSLFTFRLISIDFLLSSWSSLSQLSNKICDSEPNPSCRIVLLTKTDS